MEAREREQTQAREDLVSIIRIQVRGREGELFSWIVWVPSTVELPSTNNKTKVFIHNISKQIYEISTPKNILKNEYSQILPSQIKWFYSNLHFSDRYIIHVHAIRTGSMQNVSFFEPIHGVPAGQQNLWNLKIW